MSEIYNIIDKKKLDIVSKPIHEAHGLPNECYTNKEYTLIERKKLFEDKWSVIGAASALPEIGDAFGGRDHTTVLHACRKIAQLREESHDIKEDYANLIRTLSS